jgi:hypothetical protein
MASLVFYHINNTTGQFATAGELEDGVFLVDEEEVNPSEILLDLIAEKVWSVEDDISLTANSQLRQKHLDYSGVGNDEGRILGNSLSIDEILNLPKAARTYGEFMMREVAKIRKEEPDISQEKAWKRANVRWGKLPAKVEPRIVKRTK